MTEKRTFEEIRELILVELFKGKRTLNQLAKESGINWKTTSNHLIHLMGKGLVIEVFNSPYVRIFDLTENGKSYVALLKPRSSANFTKKTEGGSNTVSFRL